MDVAPDRGVAWEGSDLLGRPSPRSNRITVRKPGEKLGVSLAEHPEGMCVHASEEVGKKQFIGKIVSRIELIGEGRGT